MARNFRLFLAAALLLCTLPGGLAAQSADDVVKQHIKAAGGEKALKKITGARLSGIATSAGGAGSFLWQLQAPNRYYLEIQIGPRRIVEAFNGKSGWRDDSETGLRTLAAEETSVAKANGQFWNDRFLNYKNEKIGARPTGRETIEGRPVEAIEMTNREAVTRKVYFDAATRLLAGERVEHLGLRQELTYSDYRAAGGVRQPYRITLRRGGERFELAVSEAAINPPVKPEIFQYPARAAMPVPEIGVLLEEVQENQRKLEETLENYTYTMTETEIEIDKQGRVRQKSEEVSEVFQAHGCGIEQLVRKNGRELTPGEARKEKERVEKIIRNCEKAAKERERQKAAAISQPPQQSGGDPPRRQRKARNSRRNDEGDSDSAGIGDFLRTSQFVNPRRERFRGRDVLIYEFEPRPGLKPRNRAESLVQKLAGIIWIDEQARQVVRVEARMLDNYRMGGGLVASLHRGSWVVFEQELVNNEVWLPRFAEYDLSARVLLVAGMKVHRIVRFSDYKKFSVETREQVQPPRDPDPPN